MNKIDFDLFNTVSSTVNPCKGDILIAEPFLKGVYFFRSIIFITEHNFEGTVGFVLNKYTNVKVSELFDDIINFDGVLHIGGPVEQDTLHFLHTLGDLLPGSVKVTDSIFWGGNFETLKLLINKGIAKSDMVKFFLGYSGWTSGQLESEIEEKSWVVSKIDDNKLMAVNSLKSWNDILYKLGGVYKTWANFPVNPSNN